MKGEDAIELAELEDSALFGERDDELELAGAVANATEEADDHADAARVDEVGSGQVEDEVGPAVVELLEHGGTQRGRRRHVQITHHVRHRPVAMNADARSDLHAVHRIRALPPWLSAL